MVGEETLNALSLEMWSYNDVGHWETFSVFFSIRSSSSYVHLSKSMIHQSRKFRKRSGQSVLFSSKMTTKGAAAALFDSAATREEFLSGTFRKKIVFEKIRRRRMRKIAGQTHMTTFMPDPIF